MRNRGIGSLRVVNRSHDRAAELAARMGGEAVAWESLENVLAAPDIIVTSVGSAGRCSRAKCWNAQWPRARGRPVFVVDLGVPRNVAPEAAGLYNLYLYNIDDLGEIVEQNKRAREAEIPRAEAIIAEHMAKFEVVARGAGGRLDRGRSSRPVSQAARSCCCANGSPKCRNISPEERAAHRAASPKN